VATPSSGTLVVPRRFRGPATSGNGGWTSGALTTLLAGAGPGPHPPFRVRLSAPPPLETPMEVSDGRAVLDGHVVLEAAELGDVEASQGLIPVPPVPYEAAVEAGERYAGLDGHPFPECFSCGPARSPGDGLRLRPGPVEGVPGAAGVVAAAWVPDQSVIDGLGLVPVPVLWAALDCPGGWAVDIVGRPMVLGTMTAWVLARPGREDRLVVTGRAVSVSERKATTATTLYSDGEAVAVAAHVWVAVDPATFGRADPS
jgi:acyl-coenzyme A thioesterase PaaI-like protein